MEPRDHMAMTRTELALERTLLSYIRTSIVLLSSGFAIINIQLFKDISELGLTLIGIAPVFLIFGLINLKFYNCFKFQIKFKVL